MLCSPTRRSFSAGTAAAVPGVRAKNRVSRRTTCHSPAGRFRSDVANRPPTDRPAGASVTLVKMLDHQSAHGVLRAHGVLGQGDYRLGDSQMPPKNLRREVVMLHRAYHVRFGCREVVLICSILNAFWVSLSRASRSRTDRISSATEEIRCTPWVQRGRKYL